MKEKFLSLLDVLNKLKKEAKKYNLNNDEVINWIIVKTLRLKREQLVLIKQISYENYLDMEKYLIRYINGESLGKIFGYIEFYGNLFKVTENVFDPRLSTEALVTSILKQENGFIKNAKIIDLCTGSGCVAITLSKNLNLIVDALDVSYKALEIAKINAKNLNASVNFIEYDLNNDWNQALNKKYNIIVSNPPYWNSAKIFSNPEVVKDNPIIGFDGGSDGLKYIKLIIENSYNFLEDNGKLFLEIDPDLEKDVTNLFLKNGYKNIKTENDYRNILRVIYAEKNTK